MINLSSKATWIVSKPWTPDLHYQVGTAKAVYPFCNPHFSTQESIFPMPMQIGTLLHCMIIIYG